MAKKKSKQVVQKKELTIDDLSIGDIVPDLHDVDITIDNDLIEQMRQYEQDTKKSVIWRNKITGSFLFWKMNEDKPIEEESKLDEVIESEVIDEENLLLDCIADYKAEFNVKKVNTNSKKFKTFFEEWKQAE